MIYFLDTSALVKRYLAEPGSELVRGLFRRQRRIVVSRIAYAELMAAVARASREGLLDDETRDSLITAIHRDFGALDVTELRRELVTETRPLVLRHPLRAYDAVQLASALTWKKRGVSVDFWCADARLTAAARGEGLRATLVGGG